jgi:HD-GYP domain-containing protein (c-di-GMP phosphodiesterase class II)
LVISAAVLRLADVLSSLSLATDLAIGAPLETAQRTCLVATHLGRRLALPAPQLRDAFYAALLRHVGCTAWAHEAAELVGGDDHDVIRTFEGVDRARKAAVIGRALSLGKSRGAARRVRAVAGVLAQPAAGARLAAAQCAQAEALAGDLGLGPGVVTALGQMYERHDGRGAPNGLRGDEIAVEARLLAAAQLVEALHRRVGRVGTVAELARRRGRELAPEVADLAVAEAGALWPLLEEPAAEAILDAEPEPHVLVPEARLDDVALAFARFADLKTPCSIGHAPAVAALAVAAGKIAGCAAGELEALHRAALLHDVGAVTVPNGVWERKGPLGAAAWEQVRLHAYHGERVLARSPVLAPLAAIVGAHHERPDGSGYHRGARGDGVSRTARLLGAADALAAMRAERPHRAALAEAAAARELEQEARSGRLCRDAVAAVLAAAGHARVRPALPAGLTDREAEVLGLIARGLATKEIAAELGIAARTVKHHIEHIYEKTGVSTRAGAALFAARHDLIAAGAAAP